MTTFYTLGARLSGMAAVVCAALAVLAYPGQARADTMSDCYAACSAWGLSTGELSACVGQCQQQGGLVMCKGNANCTDSLGACDAACLNKMCNEGGKNPATAKCQSATQGCRCV